MTKKERSHIYKGSLALTSRGVGFFAHPDFKDDLVIEPENLKNAFNGDEVEVVVLPKSKISRDSKFKGRLHAEVVKIVKRAKETFVGTVEKSSDTYFLVPDDKKMWRDIVISKKNLAGAKIGEKCLLKVLDWGSPSRNPEGKILEVIGKKGLHEVEMKSIILEKGIKEDFPQEVTDEAAKIQENATETIQHELHKRRDFRNTLTITIDPKDAKDFDDAISFKKLPNGNLEIGVHIADVSHFVTPKSTLDKEAAKRGFSVYMVDRTIPMLPEALSNDVCSLNPNEEKLTFSAVFEITQNGKIASRWFGKTIIRSQRRFTYEEVQKNLDTKSGDFVMELTELNRIAKILRANKFRAGAIDFEQDEVKVELDHSGKPIRIYKKERLDAHKLVEEYMLLANKEVAEFIYNKHRTKNMGVFLYRIHDVPDAQKIAELSIFLRALGYDLPVKKGKVTSKDLNQLFMKIAGKAEESLIKTAAVRSMAKAIYSTQNIGHFGLAFTYYTHFTSPIRRYADLLVHRILSKELANIAISKQEIEYYNHIAMHTTEKEISAAEAERTSVKLKQVEYMKDRLGEIFEGIISGVTEWGIYVEEVNTRSEGMIRVRDLGNDFFSLDERNYRIVGEKTKKKFALGDKIKFKIEAVDLERKTMDLKLVS